MNYSELMKQLESMGGEQARKTYRRHGVDGELFGVSYSNLGALKKKIKIDHELAMELWKSRNHDARILATMIADPNDLSAGLLDEWIKDISNYVICDALATLASQSSVDRKRIEKWMKSKDEWTSSFGWSVFARVIRQDEGYTDDLLKEYLGIIERDIHSAKNRVKHTMNSALISIGVKNELLQKEAMAAAKRIGKIDVDHGDTDCETPDAAKYILKTVSRKSKSKSAKSVSV